MRIIVERVLEIICKTMQFLHLLRVQIFVALLILIPIPAGALLHEGTLVGLSDAIWRYSLAAVTMALFMLAWTLHITTRLVFIYGPARYGIVDVTDPPANATRWRRFVSSLWFTLTISAALTIPTLFALWFNTGHLSAVGKIGAMVVGFVAALGCLVLAANVHDWLERKGGETTEALYPQLFLFHAGTRRLPGGRGHTSLVTPRVATDPNMDGLFRDGQLRSGHRMALLFLASFILVYFIFFLEGLAVDYSSPYMPAALFFAYLLLTWTTWILSGLTFTLDRFHVPTISALFVLSLFLSTVLPKDHEFKVFLAQEKAPAPLKPGEVVEAWERTHPTASKGPMVVIAAEGGGIEASAWANLVLSELETATKGRLHDSVVLFSSVSGGSTGAYYYLDQFESQDGVPVFEDKQALANSEASTLSSVAWGFAYPDFARTVPLGSLLVRAYSDRGYAMEKAWRHNSGSAATMREWIDDTSKGLRPAVIFNATGSETGQPVLFGTTQISRTLPEFEGSNDKQLEQQFLLEFYKSDLAVSTAARMSASFPYVSPEGRPTKSLLRDYEGIRSSDQTDNKSPKKWWDGQRLHVADGGLFDNSGVVSAIHWIYDLSQESSASHRPIILLMITSPYEQKNGSNWSWQHQLIGPLETVLHTRTGSQHVRRNLESQLMSDLSNKAVERSHAGLPSQQSATQADPAIKSFPELTVLRFCNSTDSHFQTLSWHLTALQQKALHETWDREYGDSSVRTHAEVAALMHLLDPSQPDAAPSKRCPESRDKP